MEYHYGGGNYSGNQNNNKKPGDGDFLSWALIAIFFITGLWPLGLFLLISKLSDGSGKKRRTYGRTTTARPSTANLPQQRPVQEAEKPKSAVSKVTKTPQYGDKGSRTMTIVGLALAVLGVIAVFGGLTEIGYYSSFFDFLLRELSYPLGFLAGGIGLMLGGRGMKRRERRFAKYLAAAGRKEAVDINRLASVAEVSEPKAEKDLEIMVEKGLWGPEAFVDNSNDMLFRTQAAAAEYFYKKERPAYTPPAQTEEGYSGMLRNIRRANDRISDPALSAKIDRLEAIAGRIFKAIEDDPSRLDQAKTVLNYSLPTTQKLLDSYADFEAAGVSGANLSQAKAKIELTMDKIVEGFERQLDQLYQADAMDVDSDIKVMETMLRRDSASVEDDFGLNGGTAVQQEEK